MRETWGEWFDRHSRTFFIAPAVTLILIFAIFPTFYSIVFALSRVKFSPDGLKFTFVWFKNFEKQFFGTEQIHFLGRMQSLSILGWIFAILVVAAVLWWLVRSAQRRPGVTAPVSRLAIAIALLCGVFALLAYFAGQVFAALGPDWANSLYILIVAAALVAVYMLVGIGMLGRLVSAAMAIFVALLLSATFLSGTPWGTLLTTLFYVVVGCSVQFVIGTGLAFLCSQPIWGKGLFRVIFFIPLMITPLGVGYAFKMILDITKGPFKPFWEWIGLINWAWSADPWAARGFVILGDSWQWIPFIFITMLAALENVPRDHVEAAQVDGASSVQIFREITWPQIVPVAATVLLIRMIEAFKIVDLPNIMTSGGPGIATESMSLHSFFIWRANDNGSAAAIAYLLLILTVIVCSSFFNYVVVGQLRKTK